ncbi:DUF6515 family protein [Aquimarina sp. 2201CG5-10]|uniref:DUF6515 family protein n=1 Tax=Aquimarina callyspongiae TaxID=3098150 RepID=UPI002AB36913|nr:DUF6515 family protein [Aquimarina sp. 2201CG5-10]MDY8136422.1 DUF6515 family protein [Aquimarina sp. 2201CG5-10]
MKRILKIVLLIVTIATITTSCATTVRVQPTHRVVVTKVHKPKVIVYKNVKYYRSGGTWYIKKNRKYVTVAAPAGVRVTTLPRGYRVVKVRGVKYYKYKGVYYKKSGRKYIVVNV